MDILQVLEDFPTQESCIAHLEKVRWRDNPQCPYCKCENVARKKEGDKVGRWNCYGCKSSFNVLAQTIFQDTKIPLQKWFFVIALIMNAKKSLSSYQLSRDLKLNAISSFGIEKKLLKSAINPYIYWVFA